jgi:MerR family transcriptional regulator, redox-sensitive transcriptional activator SoxR
VGELTIGEVARRAGLRPSAIRFYESVGVLPVPLRTSGQRRYDSSVLQRLAIVRLAQEAGFTVAEVKRLFSDFDADTPASERWQALATQKLAEVEALISRAQGMKRILEEGLLRCRCPSLDECGRLISERRGGGGCAG